MNKLAAAIVVAMTVLVVPGAVSAAELPGTGIAAESWQNLSAWPRIRDTLLGRNKHRYHDRYRHEHHHHHHHHHYHDRHHRR